MFQVAIMVDASICCFASDLHSLGIAVPAVLLFVDLYGSLNRQ